MSQKSQILNRDECQALKGLAILGIVLHNFCHYLPHATLENEFEFDLSRTQHFAEAMADGAHHWLLNLFSFFGHYGVVAFIFCTGYGLAIKYESKPERVALPHFAASHYAKLVKLLLPAFVLTIAVISLFIHSAYVSLANFCWQSLLLINFLPDAPQLIKPGPYWYFGFAMQLYLLYYLAIYRRHWAWMVAMVLVCWLVQSVQQADGATLTWLRYNFVSGALPLSLGVCAARYGRDIDMSRWWWAVLTIGCAVGAWLGNYWFQAWLWAPVPVIGAFVGMAKLLRGAASRPLMWMGGISAALFAIHPLVRALIVYHAFNGHQHAWLLVYLLCSVAAALCYRQLLRLFTLKRWFNGFNR